MKQLLSFLEPIEHAEGLPNAYYVSDDMCRKGKGRFFLMAGP